MIEVRDDKQNFTSRNEAYSVKSKFFFEQHNELVTAKVALQYACYHPHNNRTRQALCPHSREENTVAVKGRVMHLEGGLQSPCVSCPHHSVMVGIYSSNTCRCE